MDGEVILMPAPCDLCGGISTHTLRQGFDWAACNECGSIKFVPVSGKNFSYNSKTEKYSSDRRVALRWGHRKGLSYIRRLISPGLIEIGCNTGEYTKKLSQYASKIVGVDINTDALEIARKRYPEINFSSELHRDLSLDTVILIDCLEHFESIEEAFEKICSIGDVKNIIISSPNVKKCLHDRTDYPPHHFYRFSIEGLEAFMRERGYTLTSYEIEYSFDLFVFNLIGLFANKKSQVYYGSGLSADSTFALRFIALILRPLLKLFNPIMRLLRIPHSAFFVVFQKDA